MAFLHGAEVIETTGGPRTFNSVRTGVIGLVGTAPKGPVNVITLVTSPRQAIELFGDQVPGTTIPTALDSIFAQGSARVLVVNVYDPAQNSTTVTDEAVTVANGRFTLANEPIGAITVTNAGGSTTYVLGTHYTFDAFGNVRILDTATIPNGTSLLVDYKYIDTTEITASLVNGSASVPRTGIELLDEAGALFGYTPKILIAPTYCELSAVSAKLALKAAKFRGMAFVDAPLATTVATAIAGRGPAGTIPGFQTSNKRVALLFPYVKAVDQLGATVDRPLSSYMAGLMAVVDNTEGYWVSPSNHEVKGILGPSVMLTVGIDDENSDVNQLNEVGIVTLFNSFGSGFRLWGNRSSAHPVETTGDVFIPIQRVKDILSDTLIANSLQFIDKPINRALIDSIRESVNAFIRSLIGLGAIAAGECIYDENDNPPEDVAAGKLVFAITFAVATPAERITFKVTLDQSLLAATLV